jgi:hypothetical protein
MNRTLNLKIAAMVGAGMLLVGCQADNVYRPAADPTVLSAHAAKETYPAAMSSEKAPDMFFAVEPNGVITLYNPGDSALTGFTVWVAKSYSIFVDKLPPHTFRSLAPETLFNATGGNLTNVPVNNFAPIQISSNGHLYDLPGPVHAMDAQ